MPEPLVAPSAGAALTVRDAATVILLRDAGSAPAILMGQRGAGAAFMPNMYVFPGGAVDAGDASVPLGSELSPTCRARLETGSRADLGRTLAAAAVRELWEETGLVLGTPGRWTADVPADWQGFAATGLLPHAAALRFIFRAITPPGRTRRFDARFFLADAAAIAGDLDDLSAACDELSHMHWVPLGEARKLNLPFITEVVLGEVAALVERGERVEGVPFFDNSGAEPVFRRL